MLRRLHNYFLAEDSPLLLSHKERLLTGVNRATLVLSLGLFLILYSSSPSQPWRVTVPAVLFLVSLSGHFLVKRGKLTECSLAYVLGTGVAVTAAMALIKGVSTPSYRSFDIIIVAAGLFIGTRAMAAVVAWGLATGGFFLLAESRGWLTFGVPFEESLYIYVASGGGMLMIALIVGIVIHGMLQSEHFKKSVAEAVPGWVQVWDLKQGRTLYENRSLAQDLGWSPGELAAWGAGALEKLMHPDDLAALPDRRRSWEQAKNGEVRETELRLKARNGEWRSLRSRDAVFRRDASGRATQIISYLHDRTEEKRAEWATRQAQRLDGLGQMAAGVAHDFNNLLTPIQGNAELLEKELGHGNPLAAQAAEIQASAMRARELTARMLSLGRGQGGEARPFDLGELVAGFVPLLRRALREDLNLSLRRPEGPLTAWLDPGEVERALLNLALNAQDAMPKGGTISLELAALDGGRVSLIVRDDGAGMSPEVRERALEPFFTTKGTGKGTGLGLTSVAAIMGGHGGELRLESSEGKGTCVELVFRGAPAAGLKAKAVDTRPHQGEGRFVLLIEDDREVRTLVRRLLESLGWKVTEAENGEEALAVAGPLEKLDLVLSDVVMPKLSGPEACARLRDRRPGLKLLFMSGYAEGEAGNHPLLASCPLLPKPFTLDELKNKLAEALN